MYKRNEHNLTSIANARVCILKSNSRLVRLHSTLHYYKDTAVAEMVSFKETDVDIIGFDNKQTNKKPVCIHGRREQMM